MTLGDLIAIFRSEVQDDVETYFVSTARAIEFGNDAVMEAARRSQCLIDSTTTAICNIAYTTDPVVALDTRVIGIKTAIVSGQSIPLDRLSVAWLDAHIPGWRSVTATRPTGYIPDYTSNKLRLHPTPTASGTVLLTVTREPLAAMTVVGDTPELPARAHRALVQWMKHRYYSIDDEEVRNDALAARAEARFTAEFGERVSFRNEQWARQTVGEMAPTLA